jgi:hypothetical protein
LLENTNSAAGFMNSRKKFNLVTDTTCVLSIHIIQNLLFFQ